MRNLRLLVIPALLAAACGGSDGDSTVSVSTAPLAGLVNGQPWTYQQGSTNAFLSDGATLFTSLYGETYGAACGSPPSAAHVILQVPTTPGEYPLSVSRSGTFSIPPSDNLVATRGTLVVEEVTQTTVTARVHVIFDAQNEVDGRFTADVCP